MRNRDLIAYLKPTLNQFSQEGAIDLADFTGQVSAVQANEFRLSIRLNLAAGFYSGRFQTTAHAFDMSTAMIEMVRAPDGKRVPVGPWDLDHIHNVMAMPMMRTYVNGKLKGGLWFDLPGPEQIAEGRLAAELGFEAQQGENELVLEIIEGDRKRIDWGKLEFFELRVDDRRTLPLLPAAKRHPRIFLSAAEASGVLTRWKGDPDFEALRKQLREEELAFLTDNSQGTLEVASLVYAFTGEREIGLRAKAKIMELANAPTWSGRPDPLLMGGDNDRGIGQRLYHCALAWEFLQPLLDDADRRAILAKVNEYIEKSYDFTLLQRAYMGYPTIEPHSLGTWNGTAIACMAFYEHLEIARRALPLYHGLFYESLTLFPASGKAAWATYFPFHMILYLAAANTFGGKRPELSSSAFLDNLGQALMACYEVPNSQELQRGLRTREHRFLTAFLCRFHTTPGIEAIYRAFAKKERDATGNVVLGIFDLLYAPDRKGEVASFPSRPLFAKDVGDVIATARGKQVIAVSISGGPKAGRRANFTLMPHNREFPPSLGAIDATIDGTPVLCNINIGTYGINSALTNTMCFDDGGGLTNGQYLNGEVPPDSCSFIRRCLIDDRYVYAHVVITHALHPKFQVRRADRIFIFDRKSGVIVLSDAFEGDRALRFATHLHCSGSVKKVEESIFRLTGGQANLIAGIKGGSKGLGDEEKGEVYVLVLDGMHEARVVTEEPAWVPAYIYGLNNTGDENISEGHYPRYRRWRLEAQGQSTHGSFLLAVAKNREDVRYSGGTIQLPDGGAMRVQHGLFTALGIDCECDSLMWDESAQFITAIGLRSLRKDSRQVKFFAPVDLIYNEGTGYGTIYAQASYEPGDVRGFKIGAWSELGDDGWRTSNTYKATFERA